MAQHGDTFVSATVTHTLICVDATEGYEISGRLFNPYIKGLPEFNGIKELLDILDRFFDEIRFPQAYYTLRDFSTQKSGPQGRREEPVLETFHEQARFEEFSGHKATFHLYVQFRRNATWQGTLAWSERDLAFPFRSTLELIKCMEEALRDSEAEQKRGGWD